MNKAWIFGAAALAGVAVSACGDDNDGMNPMDGYIEALDAMYPGASRVAEWERESGYVVAEFRDAGGFDVDVWYMPSEPVWVMTVTEGATVDDLPEAVSTALTTGDYASWSVDDIDYYERPDMQFYVIDVEARGQKDVSLYYYPDGELIKAVAEDDHDILPNTKI